VEAYNLLRAIYEERGYRLREIPRLILQKNLYGLDIDDRAAQLAGFALLMKAREDDRRLFDEEGNPPHLNVMAIQQSAGLPDEEIAQVILNAAIQIEGGDAFHSGQLFGGGQLETQHSSGLTVLDLRQLIQLFEHGKTFGSLISVPDALKARLEKIVDLLATVRRKGDGLSRSYAGQALECFAWPASLLALQYDLVVANPPYMGGKGMNSQVKEFAKRYYPDTKSDLFAMFIERGFDLCKTSGFNSMVTMQSWMFLSSYESMRNKLLVNRTLSTIVHMGNGVMGIAFGTAASVVWGRHVNSYKGSFSYCDVGSVNEFGVPVEFPVRNERLKNALPDDFKKIPGSPIAYWLSNKFFESFLNSKVSDFATTRVGCQTSDNNRFIRLWHEVSIEKMGVNFVSRAESKESKCKWVPYNKGGDYRKWYGNQEFVVNWENDGDEIFSYARGLYGSPTRTVKNGEYYFKPSVTWSKISSGQPAFRFQPHGAIFDVAGASVFYKSETDRDLLICFLNSVVACRFLEAISPTLNYETSHIASLPVIKNDAILKGVADIAMACIDIAESDWNFNETSWGFEGLFWLSLGDKAASSWEQWSKYALDRVARQKSLEEENNLLFIKAYGLDEEIYPDVAEDKINLTRASREKDSQRLVSFSIGSMMGRYSLDEPGLIYAHSANKGFDFSRYRKFPADADGIIPVTDEPWFEDDAAERVREFVKVVWGEETLVENMEWLADSLGRKAGESADEAIRRYLSTSFYKDHLQTYKKRPIYWLFSSGKQKAFECLVYLHRYNEGTLSRMRMEYVVPLQSRMQARIDKLTDDIDSATSSAQQKALQKRKDKLTKQLEELRRFDENLRPYADQRIILDLDDGVRVNYGKFGNLLAEVKTVTGGKEE
jgi:alkylhydroperoxidase/carboxymuconolactone decarboxylase family protein YurZ